MELVIVGVNYNASEVLDAFLGEWSNVESVSRIIVVDNYFNELERNVVVQKCEYYGAEILCLSNVGYGAGLNYALKHLIDELSENNCLILFGNTDVLPISVDLRGICDDKIPEIAIIEAGSNRNPFINQWAFKLMFLLKYTVYYESRILRNIWIVFQKIVGIIPGKTIAVHGAMFALTLRQLRLMHPIFNEKVFLYCEEMFFAKKVFRLGMEFKKVGIEVCHLGSVSTSKTIKKDKDNFFYNWLKSMRVYFDED